jgi:hypothetical protein
VTHERQRSWAPTGILPCRTHVVHGELCLGGAPGGRARRPSRSSVECKVGWAIDRTTVRTHLGVVVGCATVERVGFRFWTLLSVCQFVSSRGCHTSRLGKVAGRATARHPASPISRGERCAEDDAVGSLLVPWPYRASRKRSIGTSIPQVVATGFLRMDL